MVALQRQRYQETRLPCLLLRGNDIEIHLHTSPLQYSCTLPGLNLTRTHAGDDAENDFFFYLEKHSRAA